MFHVGQKVVCVDTTIVEGDRAIVRFGHVWTAVGGLDGLTKDKIYRIRDIRPCFLTGRACLFLQEIIRPRLPGEPEEAGYFASRFRPVVERKTDISVFTALLNPATPLVDA